MLQSANKGFTLVELIIFLVIIGILVTGLFGSIQISMSQSHLSGFADRATELAQERMDIILGDKAINGFASAADPCTTGSPPAICTSTAGYTVNSSITTGFDGNNNLKVIAVTVSGKGSATLTSLIGNY